MAFLNGLKRAFGFSDGDYTEDFEEYESAAVIQRPIKPQENSAHAKAPEPSVPVEESQVTPVPNPVPVEALDTIVAMLNESLPKWALPHINPDSLKNHVWELIAPALNRHISACVSNSLDRERKQLLKMKDDAEARVAQSELAIKEIQERAEEVKAQLLSLERQKSAISQRTRDLENKVASAEAENEQFRLENKSLMNKLKVVQVQSADADFFKTEIDRLNAEIKKLSSQRNEAADDSAALVAELRSAIAAHEATEISLQEKLRLANEEIQSLQDENSEAKENRIILQKIEQEFEVLERARKESEQRAVAAEAKASDAASKLADSERKVAILTQRVSEIERANSLRIKEISQAYEKEMAREREKAAKAKAVASPHKPQAKKSIAIDIDEFDDDDSGNWLQPMTVENAPAVAQVQSETAEPEPTPASIADDPRQMSLFD